MKKILVVGSINMDLSIAVDSVPKIGETVLGSDFATVPGGKGANQAVAVAKLGGDVTFFGAVGNDVYADRLLDTLKEYGIAFKGEILPDVTSGVAVITVSGGDNMIILHGGANQAITPEMIRENETLFEEADMVLMQLEIPLDAVKEATLLARKHGAAVVLNPAPSKHIPEDILKNVDMIVPNEHEAEDITGISVTDEESAAKAINKLKETGIGQVIITLGAKGCAYNNGETIKFYPAQKVKAVDTTAAGDTFIGAVLNVLAKDGTLDEAVDYATKAAAITVTRRGAAVSIPYADEIN